MDSRGINEQNLGVGNVMYAENAVTSGLGLVRSNGYFLTKDSIEQGRFTDVRTTDYRNKAGFEIRLFGQKENSSIG